MKARVLVNFQYSSIKIICFPYALFSSTSSSGSPRAIDHTHSGRLGCGDGSCPVTCFIHHPITCTLWFLFAFVSSSADCFFILLLIFFTSIRRSSTRAARAHSLIRRNRRRCCRHWETHLARFICNVTVAFIGSLTRSISGIILRAY